MCFCWEINPMPFFCVVKAPKLHIPLMVQSSLWVRYFGACIKNRVAADCYKRVEIVDCVLKPSLRTCK
jgi:hypothetical protein